MNTTDRSQILEALHNRRDEIAGRWHDVLASTDVFVPLKAAEVRQRLVELTGQAIALMLAEAFDPSGAQDVGAALARLRYTQPEALRYTQEVLARQLVQGLPPDQAVALQPRLAALLGGLAAGFVRQTRDIILTEQEQIRGALVSQLQEAEAALREARDQLEVQVEQRTVELTKANEDLRSEIAEREQAEEALRRRTEELDALRQIGLVLTSQLDLEVLLHSIVSRAMELLDGSASGLSLYYAEQDILKTVVNVGRAITPIGTVFQRGEGISGTIWDTGKPLAIDDYHNPVRQTAPAEASRVVTVLGVPIYWGSADAGGDFLGTLVVKADPPRTFAQADVELLSLFATYAAIAIRNARLYEALQEAHDKLELRVQERTSELAEVNEALRAEIDRRERVEQALRESEGVARALLNAPTDLALLIDPDGTIIDLNEAAAESLGRDAGELVGTCAFDLFPAEVAKGRKSFTEQVVRSGQSVLFEDERAGRRFSSSVYPVFDAQGDVVQIALFIRDVTDRRQAEEMLRSHADRLSVLHEIDRAILAGQSPEEIARATLSHVQKLVPCQQACIILLEQDSAEARGPEGMLLAAHGCDWTVLQEKARFPLDESLLDKLRRSDFVVIESSTASPQPSPICQASQPEAPCTYVCVPLVSKGELIGCLSLGAEGAGSFISEHLDIVQEVGDSLAIAVQHHRLITSLEEHGRQLRALGARVVEVEEDERQRMAQDLHDLVGSNLTAMGINLNLIRTNLPEQTKEMVHSRLADSLTLVEETTDLIRLVIADLRPPVLEDLGLVAALQWYGREFASRTGISVSVESDEMGPRLGTSIENVLFRIAQEALTNVTKHAQATHVTMVVTSDNEHTRLVITDDGVGFDPTEVTTSNGHQGWGLMTMAERAEAMGGRCWIESRPQQGTEVIVEMIR